MKLFFAGCLAVVLVGCKTPQDVIDARNPTPKPAAKVAPIAGVEAYPGSTEVARKTDTDMDGLKTSELDLSTPDSADKVKAFYEPILKAKSMPMNSGISSIQSDSGGSHYEVTYARMGDETTVTIKIQSHSQG